ncbi:hypothetical protein HY468_05575 [Candidatus Roizmanbacteria bacterium]|nr:hypothetical protein [Candidatus Roizmanbacteria bacterium]
MYADKPVQVDSQGVEVAWQQTNCTDIQSGLLKDSLGNTLVMGYDEFGYNYQAHMFNGTYDSSDRVLDGTYWGSTGDYVDDRLSMKWSDAWLANVDCDGDGLLDRGLVDGTVSGTSMGWLTNQVVGEYDTVDGDQHYTYFVKIGWVGPGGSLWGQYDILQENYQDPTGMSHVKYVTPGFGLNDHWTQ